MSRFAILSLSMTLLCLGFPDLAHAREAHSAGRESHSALPNLDISSGCKDVSKNDLNKTTDYSGCISEEQTARRQLKKEWASYSRDMHDQCMNLVTPPALPSYVTLQECLQMSRDAKKMAKTNGAAQIGKTMETPGGTGM